MSFRLLPSPEHMLKTRGSPSWSIARKNAADDFLHQIRFWGIAPSFAFVAQPETNGVAERFNRTLKEQAIHGRIFQNVEAVRAAVTDFKDRYNRK
jgi:transposase InsO family protein